LPSVLRREAAAPRRSTGLRDHRPSLRTRSRVEGPAALIVPALVVDRMSLGVIDQNVAIGIGDDREKVGTLILP